MPGAGGLGAAGDAVTPHRVALVTGGARGIGRAIAAALRDAGLRVVIADRDHDVAEATARALGGGVVAHALDVTDAAAFHELVARVGREVGPVDVLVNNAGIMAVGGFLDQSPRADRSHVEVNLFGVIHGMRAALPGMLERGRGHVVNVASVAGRVPTPHAAVYAATKHAVVGLTEAVRAEHLHSGVAFSYVLPAFVRTELTAGTRPPRVVAPVEPEAVGAAVARALHTREVALYVPRIARIGHVLPAVLPRALVEPLGRWFGVDRLFSGVDAQARAAYAARVRPPDEG